MVEPEDVIGIAVDDVPIDGVVEVLGAQLEDEIRQLRLRIVARVVLVDDVVIPVITAHEVGKAEGRLRPGRVDHSTAAGLVEIERPAGVATDELVGLLAADEIVVARIEREQDANAAVLVGLEDEHVPVGGGLERAPWRIRRGCTAHRC